MDKYGDAKGMSFLSLILAGGLSTQMGYRGLLCVIGAFGVFHMIGLLIAGPQDRVIPAKAISGWRFFLYHLVVATGPWIGLFLYMLI
jgi:hypothetical protein